MKGYVNTGAVGHVNVSMPRHRKGRPREVAPIDLAYYAGETAEDALAFAAAVNASYEGHLAREAARPGPKFTLAPCDHPVNDYGEYFGDGHPVHVGCAVAKSGRGAQAVYGDRSGIYALAREYNLKRYGVPERKPVPMTAKAAKAYTLSVGTAPRRADRKSKIQAKRRTAAPPVMAPAIVATDGSKAPCPRCGRSDWRTPKGRAWHVENNPECGKYRRPDRHEYAQA
jgi:hypothetical protein